MNERLPSPNRAIGCYRSILWLMPACIAITSGVGIDWLAHRFAGRGDLLIIPWLWIAINLASTIGIGIFESQFARQSDHSTASLAVARVVGFVVFQLIFILVIVGGIALFGGL